MIEIIRPLDLHQNLVLQAVRSMQDSRLSALQERAESNYVRIYLVIFVPNEFKIKASTCGFFRIENKNNLDGTFPKYFRPINKIGLANWLQYIEENAENPHFILRRPGHE